MALQMSKDLTFVFDQKLVSDGTYQEALPPLGAVGTCMVVDQLMAPNRFLGI
jgi:hypothetical protein